MVISDQPISALMHRLPQGQYAIATGLIWHNDALMYSYTKDD